MVSSNFPNRPFRLEEYVTIYAQNGWNAGNNSLVHSELWIRKNSYSPTWIGSGASASMYINGTLVGNNPNFGFDFRNSDQLLVLAQDNWFGHDGNGNMGVMIDGYCNGNILGATEVHSSFWAPRIGRPPNAPGNLRLTAGTLKTDSFGVNYDRGGENGASITNDYAEWSLDAGFTQIVWTDGSGPGTGPNGYTNPRGNGNGPGPTLIPGRTYYVRVQSDAYGIGRSGYSPTFSLQTLAALYASNGSSWLPVEVYVSNGTSWRSVEVLYSKSGVWTTPLSL